MKWKKKNIDLQTIRFDDCRLWPGYNSTKVLRRAENSQYRLKCVYALCLISFFFLQKSMNFFFFLQNIPFNLIIGISGLYFTCLNFVIQVCEMISLWCGAMAFCFFFSILFSSYSVCSLSTKTKETVDFCVYLHKLIVPFMFINFNWYESKE